MKNMRVVILIAVGFFFTACLESESKNHPPFEPKTTVTEAQKVELKKLVNETRASYEEKQKNSTH